MSLLAVVLCNTFSDSAAPADPDLLNVKISGSYSDTPGHAVTLLVEPLSYKSEGRGFDSRWCHWNFSLT